MAESGCLFCRIVAGEIPAEVVAETDTAVAFRDVNPQAPLHVLVVPRRHVADAAALADTEPEAAPAEESPKPTSSGEAHQPRTDVDIESVDSLFDL